MTQLLLIMQCTDNGSMVRAQYYSEWTELGYGMAHLSDSFVPRWLMKAQPLLCVAIKGFGHEEQLDQSCVSLYAMKVMTSFG